MKNVSGEKLDKGTTGHFTEKIFGKQQAPIKSTKSGRVKHCG